MMRSRLLIAFGAFLAFAACNAERSSPGPGPAQDEAVTLGRKIEHLEDLMAGRTLAGRALDALASALPDRVRLTEVSDDAGRIRVRGTAPSNNLLADYLARLGGSPAFAEVSLGASVMKTVKGAESWEFTIEASAAGAAPILAPSAGRLAELEKMVPARQEPAAILRGAQRLALDSGLQMARFAPGAEVSGEFTAALPAAIEVTGGLDAMRDYLRSLAESPDLWIVESFSLKATVPGDPRSPLRASIAARAHFSR